MNRHSYWIKLFTLLLSLAALSLPVAAQKGKLAEKPEKKENAKLVKKAIPVFEVLEVLKRDAGAVSNPNGKGRLVPVTVKFKLILPESKPKLVQLELITKNTDGTTTRISETIAEAKLVGQIIDHVMKLPMPEGIFAQSFDLKAVGTIVHEGVESKLNAAKSGRF